MKYWFSEPKNDWVINLLTFKGVEDVLDKNDAYKILNDNWHGEIF